MERSDPSQGDCSERDLLLEARSGDAAAGLELVARFGASMMRTAWSVLGRYGKRDGEDVVQEAFLSALTTSALPTGDVGAWLRAIVVRKALDSLRTRKRRGEQLLPDPSHATVPGLVQISGSGGEDVLIVRQALSRLSPMDRAVLTLVDLEGCTMAEAARALGATRAATKWRAVRARRRLAELLSPRENVETPQPGMEKGTGHV